jgi:hypothetical protein
MPPVGDGPQGWTPIAVRLFGTGRGWPRTVEPLPGLIAGNGAYRAVAAGPAEGGGKPSVGGSRGATIGRVDMFEPLGKTESEKGTGTARDMRFIWGIVVVCAVILLTIVVM